MPRQFGGSYRNPRVHSFNPEAHQSAQFVPLAPDGMLPTTTSSAPGSLEPTAAGATTDLETGRRRRFRTRPPHLAPVERMTICNRPLLPQHPRTKSPTLPATWQAMCETTTRTSIITTSRDGSALSASRMALAERIMSNTFMTLQGRGSARGR